MRHIHGIVQKESSAVMRMDPVMAGLMHRRMAGKKHHSAKRTLLTAAIWNRLDPKDRARIDACLNDAAAAYNCHRNDLVWAMDGPGGVVHVKKRDQILV